MVFQIQPPKNFLNPIQVEYIDGRVWRLSNDLRYNDGAYRFRIPAGFETDFATIPYCFQWLVQPTGKHSHAAILHDFVWLDTILPKAEINRLFYKNLLLADVKPWKAKLMYWSTMLYGWYWDRYVKRP